VFLLQEVMAQFKRVLERFMPQDEQQEGDAAAADGEEGAAAPAAADAAGPAHSDADSDEEGEWSDVDNMLFRLCQCVTVGTAGLHFAKQLVVSTSHAVGRDADVTAVWLCHKLQIVLAVNNALDNSI
jgi:hypothetical protein